MVKPANELAVIRRLATERTACEFFQPVLAELRRNALDTDDLLEIIVSELG